MTTDSSAPIPAADAAGTATADRSGLPDRRRADDLLRAGEARFRAALIAGRMGSWETDHLTRLRQWSEEGMALFGLALPGGVGQVGGPDDEYIAAIHPDDRQLALGYRELAHREDSFAVEYRIVRPDGMTLWLSGRVLVVERDDEGHARRVVSIMADATERKLAEEQLRTERARLGLALGAGQMGAYDTNMRDGTLWWSPQTYALFGVSEDSFVPTSESVGAMVHPDDLEGFMRQRADAIAGHRPFAHEFRIRRPDGAEIWLDHRGQAEYDIDGRPVRNFGVTMDVTARKRAEEALRDAERKKDDFIAILAHELRNPLAPIRNAVHLMRRPGTPEATRSWCHDVIDRQVSQMARLLEDLLDVSRLSSGQLQLRCEPIALATAIDRAVEIAQPLIDAGRHALTITLPSQPLNLDGDLTRLAQVFSNILINAAKYTPPNGRIALVVERVADTAVVRVTDSGIGIAMQDMPRLFKIFGQVESARSHSQGGQGIGLSLAKGLVEMHGGTIAGRSDGAGRGSEFEVRLPLTPESAPLADAVTADDAELAPTDTYRILIADDLRDAADSLARLLQAMGHTVAVAYDGEQALRLARDMRPEIVLLDLGMPKVDGYDVCRLILSQPWGGTMTLIAQTGWGHQHDRNRSREAGFHHHLVKPVQPATLVALFRRAP